MGLDSNLFIHDSDKAAMRSLKAIPGFDHVVKAFMKVWNERQYKIFNMSNNLRLSENQFGEYYAMLPPICEKLGIEVPELYLELDVYPNAYTAGDTSPFIVLTSGLFETVPKELIPTVIAHECGHIACHHQLYTTMGMFLLSGAATFISGIGNIALYPIQLAFYYWMRCSEFSADRAAMICDGSADRIIEMCMRFAGYDKDIPGNTSVEAFLKQAEEYKEMIKDNKWNKTLEFLMFRKVSHPLNAVRAYDANEWSKTERFRNIVEYVNSTDEDRDITLPVLLKPQKYIGKNVSDVESELLSKGFENITTIRKTESDKKAKDGTILSFKVNGAEDVADDYYKRDITIEMEYFEAKSEEEIAAEHPGEVKIPENYKYYIGKSANDIKRQLEDNGFTNIEMKEMGIPKLGFLTKEGTIAKIIIDKNSKFEKDTWYYPDVKIIIYRYVSLAAKDEEAYFEE